MYFTISKCPSKQAARRGVELVLVPIFGHVTRLYRPQFTVCGGGVYVGATFYQHAHNLKVAWWDKKWERSGVYYHEGLGGTEIQYFFHRRKTRKSTVFVEQPLALPGLLKTSKSFDRVIFLQIPAAAAHQRGGAPSIVSPSKVTLPACSTLAQHIDKKCSVKFVQLLNNT